MTINKNTIGTLFFDIETYNEKHALEIQQSVSGFGRKEIPAILEESLIGPGMNDSITVIDKLEIDLGEITTEDFKANFLALFRNKFSEELSLLNFDPQIVNDEDARVLSRQKSDIETLQHFLLTGQLPWYAEVGTTELKEIFQQLVEIKSEDFFQFVRDHISNEIFIKRLVYQFEAKLIVQLVSKLFELNLKEHLLFTKKVQFILTLSPTSFGQIDYPKQLMLITLTETISFLKRNPDAVFEEAFLLQLSGKLKIEYAAFVDLLIEQITMLKSKEPEKIDPSFLLTLIKLSRRSLSDEKSLTTSKIGAIEGEETEKEDHKAPDDQPISFFISNAGLVLLHAFLPELFRKIKLIVKNEFVDEKTIHKAIHLSQYAVFGNKARPEHLLILNKLLCGYPLESPVPIKVMLSATEKSEATRMINAAIKHWEALKNTSAKGFRSSFMQREGLLKQTDDGWQLFVEREAFDVLLNQIPWSYHIVKLPWMDQIIRVEW